LPLTGSGGGEIMPYLNQVDALLHEARRLFAHAEHEAGNWPHCGHLLARALEHATCAVFMAWDEPHAPETKMHRFFDERLAPHADPAMAALVRFVWARDGQGRPDTAVEQLLAVCRGAIEYFAGLAQGPPPAGWVPLPIPQPIDWGGLSDQERQFLQEALPAAAEQAAGVRLILFGSRAVGTAGPGSDYDVFFIFPDQTADWQRPQSIGSVSSLAIARGIELSVESASAEQWLNPPEVSRPLIERVKATGIEVPRPEPGEPA
jgi:predicted nucleotidyltransferase